MLRGRVARVALGAAPRRQRHLAGAGGSAHLPVAHRRGEHRRSAATPKRKGPWNKAAVLAAFPLLEPLLKRYGATAVGRRAADARHRAGADVEPATAAARRGVARARALVVKQVYEAIPVIKAAGHDGPGRRAGRQPGAGRRRPLLLPARRSGLARPARPADVTKEQITEAYFGLDRARGAALMVWVNAIVQGILLGGLYALFATGLSLALRRRCGSSTSPTATWRSSRRTSRCRSRRRSASTRSTLVIIVSRSRSVSGYLLQRLVFDRVVGVDPAFQIVATFGLGDRHPERAARELHGRHARARRRLIKTASDQDQRHDQHRVAAAHHAALRDRRARRARAVHQAHAAGPSLPGDLGRSRTRRGSWASTSGAIFGVAMALAVATVALAGVLSGAASSFDPVQRSREADLRVRGGHHRRPRLAVGHARRRHHPRRRRRRSAARSTRSGASSPATSCSSPVLVFRPTGLFGKVAGAAMTDVPIAPESRTLRVVPRSIDDQPHLRRGRDHRRRPARLHAVVGRGVDAAQDGRAASRCSRWPRCGTCSPDSPACLGRPAGVRRARRVLDGRARQRPRLEPVLVGAARARSSPA